MFNLRFSSELPVYTDLGVKLVPNKPEVRSEREKFTGMTLGQTLLPLEVLVVSLCQIKLSGINQNTMPCASKEIESVCFEKPRTWQSLGSRSPEQGGLSCLQYSLMSTQVLPPLRLHITLPLSQSSFIQAWRGNKYYIIKMIEQRCNSVCFGNKLKLHNQPCKKSFSSLILSSSSLCLEGRQDGELKAIGGVWE